MTATEHTHTHTHAHKELELLLNTLVHSICKCQHLDSSFELSVRCKSKEPCTSRKEVFANSHLTYVLSCLPLSEIVQGVPSYNQHTHYQANEILLQSVSFPPFPFLPFPLLKCERKCSGLLNKNEKFLAQTSVVQCQIYNGIQIHIVRILFIAAILIEESFTLLLFNQLKISCFKQLCSLIKTMLKFAKRKKKQALTAT